MTAAKLPQYAAALSGSLGGVALGTMFAWSSPAGPKLKNDKDIMATEDQVSWIGSLMPLGAAFITLFVGYLMDKFGRKFTLLGLVIPCVVGYCFLAFSKSVAMFCAGRFITGLGGGGISIVVPVYIAEISEKRIRGRLSTSFELLMCLGILFTYVVGYYVTVMWLSIICGIVAIIFGVVFAFMPESPRYHVKAGQEKKAIHSMRWLRGNEYDIEIELNEIEEGIRFEEQLQTTFKEMLLSRSFQRAILICFGLIFFQQMGGINAIVFYTVQIFKDAGSSVNENVSTIITGCVEVGSTALSALVVDKAGRKILLIISGIVMAICCMLLGMYFYMKKQGNDVTTIQWLPLLLLTVYIIAFSLAYGPIPWFMTAEVFTPETRGKATSAVVMFKWILAFIVTKFYANVASAFGPYTAFWSFGVISCISVVFVVFIVIETKGKSLEEIQRELQRIDKGEKTRMLGTSY